MLGAGTGDAHDVHFLERIVPDERRGNLSRENDEGDGIAVSRGNPGHSIGSTGAGGSETNAHLAGSAGIPVGGMDSTLFMPHQNMAQIRMVGQLVININDSPAGIAEEKVDAFALQTLQKYPGPGAQHQLPSCSL